MHGAVGRSRQLSETTIADYRGVLFGGAGGRDTQPAARSLALIHRCGRRPIAALDDSYWQSIIDELVRDGKSHSRIATYLAVIRHIYAYARRPNLRVVTNDPTRELEMPANDGKVRERVATADEAAKLIEALPVSDSAGALSWESVTRDPGVKPERRCARTALRRERRARRQSQARGALQDT